MSPVLEDGLLTAGTPAKPQDNIGFQKYLVGRESRMGGNGIKKVIPILEFPLKHQGDGGEGEAEETRQGPSWGTGFALRPPTSLSLDQDTYPTSQKT